MGAPVGDETTPDGVVERVNIYFLIDHGRDRKRKIAMRPIGTADRATIR
jgi:hypothetical protein